MLTKLTIRNFKKFDSVEIPLSKAVVFVGPNNSGKTTALQALALWELGLRRLREKPTQTEVVLNRRDLVMVPAPSASLLWRELVMQAQAGPIRIEIVVEGVLRATNQAWACGIEFGFSNEESLNCRLMPGFQQQAAEAYPVKVAYLPRCPD